MGTKIFRSAIAEKDNFAVAVPTETDSMMIIQTYPTREALEGGYNLWKNCASQRKLTTPYPIERGEDGWHIMEEYLNQ